MSGNSRNVENFELSAQEMVLPLLPLRDILVFPSNVVPLFVGRKKSILALEKAMSGNKSIMLVAQKNAESNDPSTADLYSFGTVCLILQLLRLPDGTIKVLVEGRKRARILNYEGVEHSFMVKASEIKDKTINLTEDEALIRTVKLAFHNYIRLTKRASPDLLLSISQIEDISKLSDTLTSHIANLKLEDKQSLLEQLYPSKRLEKLYSLIQNEIEIMRTEKKIRARVKRQMEKTQKEYYLNEQMTAIQKELGDRDEVKAEIDELEKTIETKKFSKTIKEKLSKEVKKLKQMSPMSAEASVIRNYLDTALSLPWGKFTSDNKDVDLAVDILNRDHFGLEKIKDRVVEYISIKNFTKNIRGPILCLVGPPGVGKTSLAKSIAESLGRNFVKVSLGGVRDQSEIRGHRKTYIGSMPGRIISALRKSSSSNPVILLDEIDKMGMDHRGDPASALLEVLDPEQNDCFNDHYLDLDYDLSKCMFIATANSSDQIPGPLLDRTELMRLSGYTEIEKLEIVKKFILPKQIKENGLRVDNFNFMESAILHAIRYYTRESGVRQIEREVASIIRKVIRKNMKKILATASSVNKKEKNRDFGKTKEKGNSIVSSLKFTEKVTPKVVEDCLGVKKYYRGTQHQESKIGLCNGLAWTPYGGDVLIIEVAILPGKGKLMITGKLGDVMQESAQAALSYVRSRSSFLGVNDHLYNEIDIHIHVPEGAVPKDGPSAGLCMATALTSAIIKRPISNEIAMTGEITLSGRSLPIGGLKEKSLAAHRLGIKKVLFPTDNLKDVSSIPESIRNDINFISVRHMDDVLIHSLVWDNIKSEKNSLYLKLIKNTKCTENNVYTVN